MSLNYAKLNWKISEVCGTQGKLAKAIGVSEHTVSKKLNQRAEFKTSEILKISEVLGISSEEIGDYFFEVNVQSVEHSEAGT